MTRLLVWFNTATVDLVLFVEEIVFGPTYTARPSIQVGVLLVSVVVLVVLTGGRLGYDASDKRQPPAADQMPVVRF